MVSTDGWIGGGGAVLSFCRNLLRGGALFGGGALFVGGAVIGRGV